MDAARHAMCFDNPVNPFISNSLQAAGVLVVSHIFHLILKPLGQPGPVAQILAGFVFGPSVLSRIKIVRDYFIKSFSEELYRLFTSIFSVLFTFLIGLETDIPYLKRNFRKVLIVAGGGLFVCSLFGMLCSISLIEILDIKSGDDRSKDAGPNKSVLVDVVMVLLGNTALPVVFRLAVELKIAAADVGRLAICSAIVAEVYSFLWFSIHFAFLTQKRFLSAVLIISVTIVMGVGYRYFAEFSNRQHGKQKYMANAEISAILIVTILVALKIDDSKFKNTLFCYFLGLMFPRGGKMTRTIVTKLGYAVYNFVLPVYFGYIGFQFNVASFYNYRSAIIVGILILLSMGGKIIGTLAACQYLRIRMTDGFLLSFLLNMKGHAEILLIDSTAKSSLEGLKWEQNLRDWVILVSVVNTVFSGVAVACILKKYEKYFNYRRSSVEMYGLEDELRLLTCVYDSRYISSKLGLVWAMSGSLRTPVVAHLFHLVELPKRHQKTNLMYHQLDDGDQFSDEEEYGGDSVLEINDAVDAFTLETGLLIRPSKVVSSFARMFEDVCDEAEDLRVSIIIITFHKHQRLDRKMEAGKQGMRTTNQKVLRHAPCSVGIFVDRGQTGFQLPSGQSLQNVAVLFFGGPDDREALACSERITTHPHLKLTLIRFIQSSFTENDGLSGSSRLDDEMLMAISAGEIDDEADNAAVEEFYNRYVPSGQVGYIERNASNGLQTVEVLRSIGETYELFIVGRGGRGDLPMTTNMSDWEECPELGTVGDLLASEEISINGSVLVIQQHRHSRNLFHS